MLDFVFCGSELTDSRKRTKLNGKVSDLPDRISSVLNVPLSNINVDGYICNERSYRDLKRLEKILEDAKSLQPQSFTTNNRTKRCVPSDSRISPSVSAPLKSPRHAMDQGSREGRTFCFDVIISATIFARRKSAGGNMIGLNQQRKSHASSRSFGGWVRAHFPEQRLVIEPSFVFISWKLVWKIYPQRTHVFVVVVVVVVLYFCSLNEKFKYCFRRSLV